MSLNANKVPSNSNFVPMEPGSYPTRTVMILDLGLQNQPDFQGKEKAPARMIGITYEFVDEFMKDEDGNDDPEKPRWLTEMMPLYNLKAEKAKSTARYHALDPNGVYDGDFSKLINVPCMVTVVHNPGKNRVYENIAAVTAMRDKDAKKCPELINDPVVFDLEEPDLEQFLKLPEWLQDKIKNNLEYEGSELQRLLKDVKAGGPPKDNVNIPDEDLDDEVPF